jgi:hypothetical protein
MFMNKHPRPALIVITVQDESGLKVDATIG